MRILHVGRDFLALRPCGLTAYSDALMRAQAAAGDEVSYFFSGRRYPLLRRPFVRHWRSGDVHMAEFIGSPINTHWEVGTRYPERDIDEPHGLDAFARVLERVGADVVHIHELSGLPSSVIEHAKRRGIPVVMTLHDYTPICASSRLVDGDGQRCNRVRVADACARSCRWAPEGYHHLIDKTVRFELARAKRATPGLRRIDFQRVEPAVRWMTDRSLPDADRRGDPLSPDVTPPSYTPAARYQHRREENLRRLSLCDRLVAPSARVAEIYAALGLDPAQISVQRLTLPHLERLEPRAIRQRESGPLRLVTLGGASHPTKGSHVLADAVEQLAADRRSGDYRLFIVGPVDPAVQARLAAHEAVEFGPIRYRAHDLDELLGHCDVGVMPSAWEEPHGFVGIEMLAKGLPLIGNALGGIPEYVVEGQTGWLNHDADGAGLASVIARLIDDRDQVERVERSVRTLRPQLVPSMDAHLAEVRELYRSVVGAGLLVGEAA